MIRYPAVEGRFYPSTKKEVIQLFSEIESSARYPGITGKPGNIIGAVLPHAGHIYSGHQTIPFFRYISENRLSPETFVVLNPNHTGLGQDVALDPHVAWKNSLGEIGIDVELNSLLPYPMDKFAQKQEHSAEVIIPYIQHYCNDRTVKILPICMKRQSAETARMIAAELYSAIQRTGRKVMIIASSDFSHFLAPEIGYKFDQLILDMLRDKNILGIETTVKRNNISVCGYGPIMTLMAYAEKVDKDYQSMIIARGHSGEVHFSKEVVDYISVLFHQN